MRVKALTVLSIILLSSFIAFSFHSPSESFTLKVTITMEPRSEAQVVIRNVTVELLNSYAPQEDTVYPTEYRVVDVSKTQYVHHLTLRLRGLSTPYHMEWNSTDMTIQTNGRITHYFQNVEPGEYLLRTEVYLRDSEKTEEPTLVVWDTFKLWV